MNSLATNRAKDPCQNELPQAISFPPGNLRCFELLQRLPRWLCCLSYMRTTKPPILYFHKAHPQVHHPTDICFLLLSRGPKSIRHSGTLLVPSGVHTEG